MGPARRLFDDQPDARRRITLNHRYEFGADAGATVLRREFSAFGPISDELAEGIEGQASLESFEPQLRSWIENGEVIPPPEL